MRKEILPVNLHAGRNWSYLSAARCFPAHFLWVKSFFCFLFFSQRALDENSEPDLIGEEDTESKREITGYALSENSGLRLCARVKQIDTERVTGEDCGCVSKL